MSGVLMSLSLGMGYYLLGTAGHYWAAVYICSLCIGRHLMLQAGSLKDDHS